MSHPMSFLMSYSLTPQSLAIAIGISFLSTTHAQSFPGYNCDRNQCKPPSCRCADAGRPVPNPPQFIVVTYDDSIQGSVYPQATALFKNRRNPNGCPAKATWYAQVLYSDPYLTTQWYAQGNEVADHSVTHVPPFAGSYQELEGMRAWASSNAGVPRGKITGVRFPFRNFTVESINMLASMGFTYDTSMAATGAEKVWPYTLDYGAATDCNGLVSVCGKQLAAKGLWEIPMYNVEGADGLHLMDPFNDPSITSPNSPANVLNDYKTTFDKHNQGDHVPFGVYLHPVWIGPANPPSIPDGRAKFKAVSDFLDYAMSQPNVWMVTNAQLIAYMKNPVSASEIGSQPYMQCNLGPQNSICNGLGPDSLVESCNLPDGTLRTCYGCPDVTPSLQNPAPKKSGSKRCPVPDNCDMPWWDPIGCKCLCTSSSCAWTDESRQIQLDGLNVNGGNPSSKGTNGKDGDGKNASYSNRPFASSLVIAALLSLGVFLVW